jgi:heat shock protein HslJ
VDNTAVDNTAVDNTAVDNTAVDNTAVDNTADRGDQLGLDGRRFWSISVIEGGAERALVDGTQVELTFDGGQIGASAGCNSMGGNFTLEDDVLVVGDLFATEIGCEPDRQAQDEFVAGFITARPVVALDGESLTLSTANVTMELADLSGDVVPLTGTTWVVTGFIDGEAATSFAVTDAAFVVFDDGTLTGFDGCEEITAPVEVADGSTGGPVSGAGEIQFGSLSPSATGEDCREGEYRDLVRRALAGQASYTIENGGPETSNLTISYTSGMAMTLTSR